MVGFIIDNIGTWELLIILMVALMVFGPEKVPELARNAARMGRKLSKMTNELKNEFGSLVDLDDDEDFHRRVKPKVAEREMLKEIVESKVNMSATSMSAAPIIKRDQALESPDAKEPAAKRTNLEKTEAIEPPESAGE